METHPTLRVMADEVRANQPQKKMPLAIEDENSYSSGPVQSGGGGSQKRLPSHKLPYFFLDMKKRESVCVYDGNLGKTEVNQLICIYSRLECKTHVVHYRI